MTQRKAMPTRFFLGGTCNDSDWRKHIMPELDRMGVNYFNPVVEDWNEEAQQLEILEKTERCTHHLYVITPEMKGVFSIAEMVESAVMMPKSRTYACFLQSYNKQSFDDGQWRSLMAVNDMLGKYDVYRANSLPSLIRTIAHGMAVA